MSERVLVWLLIERDGAYLFALRKADEPPFAGQLTLPGDEMQDDESSAETIGRVAREELGISTTGEEFVDTLYLSEGDDSFPTNVFRLTTYDGTPRFRESGPYIDVRWGLASDVTDMSLPVPQPLRDLILRIDAEGRTTDAPADR